MVLLAQLPQYPGILFKNKLSCQGRVGGAVYVTYRCPYLISSCTGQPIKISSISGSLMTGSSSFILFVFSCVLQLICLILLISSLSIPSSLDLEHSKINAEVLAVVPIMILPSKEPLFLICLSHCYSEEAIQITETTAQAQLIHRPSFG